jgi:hypothetical protein
MDEYMKVTPQELEDEIVHEIYLQPIGTLTICVVTTRRGMHLVGSSGCLDPRMFDAEVGRRIARADAVNKLWPILGHEKLVRADVVINADEARTRLK